MDQHESSEPSLSGDSSIDSDAAKIEPARAEAPKVEIPKIEEQEPAFDRAAGSTSPRDIAIAAVKPRMSPAIVLAASIAMAAALGSVVGAVTSMTMLRPSEAAPAAVATVSKGNFAQISGEIAALKADTKSQLSQLTQRIDRAEKAQAEPFAKIGKMADAIERLEKKSTTAAAAASDITGSIGTSAATAPAAGANVAKPQRPPVLEGWVLRDVSGGRAWIESRTALYQVVTGSILPNLGRVESIRREDGRWIVVTQKGLVVSAR